MDNKLHFPFPYFQLMQSYYLVKDKTTPNHLMNQNSEKVETNN